MYSFQIGCWIRWAAYLISKCKLILTFIEFRICPFDLCLFSRRANFVNLFVKGQNSDIYQTACKNVENSYHQCHHSMGMSCSLKRPFEYKNKGKMNTENENIYRKVSSRSTSRLVAHPSIFRMFMKGKFDAYVLWPLAKSFQNWIVDRSTARHLVCSFFQKSRGVVLCLFRTKEYCWLKLKNPFDTNVCYAFWENYKLYKLVKTLHSMHCTAVLHYICI